MLSGCAQRPVRHDAESSSPRVNPRNPNPKSEEPPQPIPHTAKSGSAVREVREQREVRVPSRANPEVRDAHSVSHLSPDTGPPSLHVPLDKCEATPWAFPVRSSVDTPVRLKWLVLVRFRLVPSPRLPSRHENSWHSPVCVFAVSQNPSTGTPSPSRVSKS